MPVKLNSIFPQLLLTALMVITVEGCLHHGSSSADASADARFADLHSNIVDGHKAAAQQLGYYPDSFDGNGTPSRQPAAVVSDCPTAGNIVATFADSGGMSPAGWVLVTCHSFTYPLDANGNVTGLLATVKDGSPVVGFSQANCQGTQYVSEGPGVTNEMLAAGVGYKLDGAYMKAGGPNTSKQSVDFASSISFDTHGRPQSCQNVTQTGIDAYVASDNDASTGITSAQISPTFGSP